MVVSIDAIRAAIRDIPDFPRKGILFKDITPVLADGKLFKSVIDLFCERTVASGATRVVGIDARGFIFGAAVADRLGLGFIPVRKAGKLPYDTYEESYELEYGSNTVAIHRDALEAGESVVMIDDLLATGGTAAAAAKLIESAGGRVADIQFLIELTFLNGREKLKPYPVYSAVTY